MRLPGLFLCFSVIAAVGCGTPGAPQAPSLEIPKAVSDLKAVRKGDTVILTWTVPIETTDGALVRRGGKMLVERNLSADPTSPFNTLPPSGSRTPHAPLAQLPLPPALNEKHVEQATHQDSLKAILEAPTQSDFVRYTLISVNGSSRSEGQSNPADVPLVLTLPAPENLEARTVPQGIELTWDSAPPPQGRDRLNPQYAYRVMRLLEGAAAPVAVKQIGFGQAGAGTVSFLDAGIEWEKRYQYWVTPVTSWQGQGRKGEVEGNDSAVVPVFAHDVFPPAAPTGLQAVFSGVGQQPFIDLTWTPNSEDDLAGYNVYRHRENEPPARINGDLVKTPAFRDNAVQPRGRYFYSVSAVDLRGNESGKSQETSESVPQE